MVFGEFAAGPRAFAVGAAYLRGMGNGRIARIDGVQALKEEFGNLIVEAELPQPGALQPPGYEGAGYVIFRHADTAIVETALRRTVQTIRIHLA